MPPPTRLHALPIANGGKPARRIFIHDLTLDCRIGIHHHEQDIDQRVRINIDLIVSDLIPIEDSIANVIDYDHIVSGIEAVINSGRVNLVETLADRIGDFCMADTRVMNARVRVEKLDAIARAVGAGVEVERYAEDQ